MTTTQRRAEQVGRGLLADRTYETLKSAILANRLTPGTPLSVPELARQLDVSRSPVREAVQRLIYDGLATHVPHRGALVTTVDRDDLRELYVVREMLEGLAARLATERGDRAGLARLQAIVDDHEVALTTPDDARVAEILGGLTGNAAHIELDRRFHGTIRELAANAHLTAALEPITGRSHFALHSLWRSLDAARLALDEHHRILDAMVVGDIEGAELAARQHIARLRTRLAHASAPTDEAPRRGRPRARLVD